MFFYCIFIFYYLIIITIFYFIGWTVLWLGASDEASEGNFEWISPRCRFSAYTNWHNNEPNNGVNGNCLQIYRHHGMLKWDDTRCSYRKKFICEFQQY